MPKGILINVFVTLVGGIVGCLLGKLISERWKSMLNNVLGIAAIVMGLVLIMRYKNLSACVLSLVVGAVVGEALQIESWVNKAAVAVTGKLLGGSGKTDEAYLMMVSAALVLFCCGGTGWYGAINEGLTGDGSILITKGILDCVTAGIFAALLGKIVVLLCVPQIIVYMILFFLGRLIGPFITDVMIADFSAVGGMITLVAGLRLAKIKTDIKVLNLLPALILSFFISALWTAVIG